MHRKRARRIWGDLKKSVSWELDSEREWSTFGARWGQTNLCATGATRVGGVGRWKIQNRKNVYLSPYVEEPLNSKVIKSFVPELRSHKCFSCFGIPMFYVYMLWTFYVRFTYPYHGYGTIDGLKERKKKVADSYEVRWINIYELTKIDRYEQTHTHTHTHTYIYIYIMRVQDKHVLREWDRCEQTETTKGIYRHA